ncbi:MAG: triose-phosphate isomerase [Actinomycetota bacterium]
MRKPIIAGNWKMNKTVEEAVELVQDLIPLVMDVRDVEIVVCPPFTALKSVSTVIEFSNPNIFLGAQDMHWGEKGAYTGEISPVMLLDLGVKYVIIGHSERRRDFGETNEVVNKKVISALSHGLIPIMCIGETLEQREAGETQRVVTTQLLKGLEGLKKEDIEKVVIAYEPVWAIGTGRSATPEDANDVIRSIRALIGAQFDVETAKKVRIQYGGSVTPENITGFMEEPEIDGALVGGASLDAGSFAKIIKFHR